LPSGKEVSDSQREPIGHKNETELEKQQPLVVQQQQLHLETRQEDSISQSVDMTESDSSRSTMPHFRSTSPWRCRVPTPMGTHVCEPQASNVKFLPTGWIPRGRSSSRSGWRPPLSSSPASVRLLLAERLQTNKVASTSKCLTPAETQLARDNGASSPMRGRLSSAATTSRLSSKPPHPRESSQSPRLALPQAFRGAPEVPPPTATEQRVSSKRRSVCRSDTQDSPRLIHLPSSLAAALTLQTEECHDACTSPSNKAQNSRMQSNCNRVARRLHGNASPSANTNSSGFSTPNTEVDRAIENIYAPVRRTSVPRSHTIHSCIRSCTT